MRILAAAAALTAAAVLSPRRLLLAADEVTVVEEGDERGAFLLVAKDCETSDPRALAYLGYGLPGVGEARPTAEEGGTTNAPAVPMDVYDALLGRFDVVQAERDTLQARVAEMETALAAKPAESLQTSAVDAATPLSGLPDDVTAALVAAGFDTVEKVRAATDAQIDAIKGFGEAAIAKIREATKEA